MSVFRELIYEIAQDCERRGVGTFSPADPANRNIFIGQFPQDVQEGILLLPVNSPNPHQYIDTEYPIIDFWARAPHTDRATALLRSVYNAYHRNGGFSTTNWRIYFSQSLGTIVDVDRDAESGKLMRLSVQFLCRNLNNLS